MRFSRAMHRGARARAGAAPAAGAPDPTRVRRHRREPSKHRLAASCRHGSVAAEQPPPLHADAVSFVDSADEVLLRAGCRAAAPAPAAPPFLFSRPSPISCLTTASTRPRSRRCRRLTEEAPPDLDDILEYCLPYLSIKDVFALKLTAREIGRTAALHAPDHLSLVKIQLASTGPSLSIFRAYGATLHSVSLQRVTSADPLAIPAVLALCPALRRAALVDCDWTTYNDESVGSAMAAQRSLLELRLQAGDAISAERNPFAAIVRRLDSLSTLRKLTLFSRLDSKSMAALISFLTDPRTSRRLIKLKISTGLLAGDAGAALLDAVAAHGSLMKLTIVRPDGVGEPLRKSHCAALAVAMVKNKKVREAWGRRAMHACARSSRPLSGHACARHRGPSFRLSNTAARRSAPPPGRHVDGQPLGARAGDQRADAHAAQAGRQQPGLPERRLRA